MPDSGSLAPDPSDKTEWVWTSFHSRSLYNGLSAGLQRQMCFASVRLGLYDTFKAFYQQLIDGTPSLISSLSSDRDIVCFFVSCLLRTGTSREVHFEVGFICGPLVCCFGIAFALLLSKLIWRILKIKEDGYRVFQTTGFSRKH